MARVTCGSRRDPTGALGRGLQEGFPVERVRQSRVPRTDRVRAWFAGPSDDPSRLSPLFRPAFITLVSLLMIAALPRPAAAQPEVDLSHWRFYSSVDGLRESWVEDITPGRDGRFWITHGSVDSMTLFDGYTFQRFPTPGVNLTVREGVDGLPWALHRDGVVSLRRHPGVRTRTVGAVSPARRRAARTLGVRAVGAGSRPAAHHHRPASSSRVTIARRGSCARRAPRALQTFSAARAAA